MVCDLGIDTVFTYKRTAEGLEEVAQYKTKAGSGPRHLAFHPTLPIAYLICELDATVEVLSYNKENGTFTNLDKIALTTEDQQAWEALFISLETDDSSTLQTVDSTHYTHSQ